ALCAAAKTRHRKERENLWPVLSCGTGARDPRRALDATDHPGAIGWESPLQRDPTWCACDVAHAVVSTPQDSARLQPGGACPTRRLDVLRTDRRGRSVARHRDATRLMG